LSSVFCLVSCFLFFIHKDPIDRVTPLPPLEWLEFGTGSESVRVRVHPTNKNAGEGVFSSKSIKVGRYVFSNNNNGNSNVVAFTKSSPTQEDVAAASRNYQSTMASYNNHVNNRMNWSTNMTNDPLSLSSISLSFTASKTLEKDIDSSIPEKYKQIEADLARSNDGAAAEIVQTPLLKSFSDSNSAEKLKLLHKNDIEEDFDQLLLALSSPANDSITESESELLNPINSIDSNDLFHSRYYNQYGPRLASEFETNLIVKLRTTLGKELTEGPHSKFLEVVGK
jgi:hypothetical protein